VVCDARVLRCRYELAFLLLTRGRRLQLNFITRDGPIQVPARHTIKLLTLSLGELKRVQGCFPGDLSGTWGLKFTTLSP
jgi:hypothetical protein